MNPSSYVLNLISNVRQSGGGLVSDELKRLPFCFSGDGLMVFGRNLGFLKDQRFIASYKRALDRFEVPQLRPILESIIWRKHILCSLANQAKEIQGDFVECGVEWGFGIDVVSNYINFSEIDKKWFLFDTFAGVPTEDIDEGFVVSEEITKPNQFDQVKKKFSAFENLIPVQGKLPDVLSNVCPKKIAFLHIDLNNAAAESATFLRLYPYVAIGGIIVFDDYGALLFAKQHFVEKEIFKKLGVTVTELPTGQAILIKTSEAKIDIDVEEILRHYCFDKFIDGEMRQDRLLGAPMLNEVSINEMSRAFDHFKSQISCINNFAQRCNDKNLSYHLFDVVSKYSQVMFFKKESECTYSTIHEYYLSDICEARFDLQTKIDELQNIIDKKCHEWNYFKTIIDLVKKQRNKYF